MPNAIDLTTVSAVKSWCSIVNTTTDQDQNIQDSITAFSAYFLRRTGRGPLDGTIPTTSPFVTPVSYDDVYDGTGTLRQPIRNWPITAVSSVTIDGATIPQSTSIQVWGWVVDGDKKFITLRGGYSATVATFQNSRLWRGAGGLSGRGFSPGVQNVEIVYTAGFAAIPFDLEMCARRTVGLQYKRRGWIGLNMQAMAAGAGTVAYNNWEMEKQDASVLEYYKAQIA